MGGIATPSTREVLERGRALPHVRLVFLWLKRESATCRQRLLGSVWRRGPQGHPKTRQWPQRPAIRPAALPCCRITSRGAPAPCARQAAAPGALRQQGRSVRGREHGRNRGNALLRALDTRRSGGGSYRNLEKHGEQVSGQNTLTTVSTLKDMI